MELKAGEGPPEQSSSKTTESSDTGIAKKQIIKTHPLVPKKIRQQEEISFREIALEFKKKFGLLTQEAKNKFVTLKERELLLIALAFIGLGVAGFVISLLGWTAASFLGFISLGILLVNYVAFKRVKKTGLLHFAPQKIQNLMKKWSVFDVICELVYFRTTTKMIQAIV